jgi:hypothetical protein
VTVGSRATTAAQQNLADFCFSDYAFGALVFGGQVKGRADESGGSWRRSEASGRDPVSRAVLIMSGGAASLNIRRWDFSRKSLIVLVSAKIENCQNFAASSFPNSKFFQPQVSDFPRFAQK